MGRLCVLVWANQPHKTRTLDNDTRVIRWIFPPTASDNVEVL